MDNNLWRRSVRVSGTHAVGNLRVFLAVWHDEGDSLRWWRVEVFDRRGTWQAPLDLREGTAESLAEAQATACMVGDELIRRWSAMPEARA